MDSEADSTDPHPPIWDLDLWTHELQQTPIIRQEIDRNIVRLARWIDERAPVTPLTGELILGFHRTLFAGVLPDAAGRLRGPAPRYVPWSVEFGNYRGERWEDVPDVCATFFARIEQWVSQMDELRGHRSATFIERQALMIAAYTHCELVRIHPFIDGNGRTARARVNYFARRYGGRMPLPFTRPYGDDYKDAQRTYQQRRIHDHFADYLRTMWPVPEI